MHIGQFPALILECSTTSGPGSLTLGPLDAKVLQSFKSIDWFFWADSSEPWCIACCHRQATLCAYTSSRNVHVLFEAASHLSVSLNNTKANTAKSSNAHIEGAIIDMKNCSVSFERSTNLKSPLSDPRLGATRCEPSPDFHIKPAG